MTDEQRKPRWRAKRQPKPHRTVLDKLFGAGDGDSDEKVAQSHTGRGRDLAAEDRRNRVKGGSGGGLAG